MVIKSITLYLVIILSSLAITISDNNPYENQICNTNNNNTLKIKELNKDLEEINNLLNNSKRQSIISLLAEHKITITNSIIQIAKEEQNKVGVCNSNSNRLTLKTGKIKEDDGDVDGDGDGVYKEEIISVDPDVRVIHNFLKEGEAEHFISKFKDRLKESIMLKPNGEKYSDQGRTSTSSFLDKAEDPIVKSVEERIAKYTNTTIKNMEPLQLVNYKKGQHYLNHYDWFSETQAAYWGGQRRYTVLLYLTDVPSHLGGGTTFYHLNKTVTPIKNSALFWNNLKDDGSGNLVGNPKTLHQGNALLTDKIEKYAINSWIRLNNYDP